MNGAMVIELRLTDCAKCTFLFKRTWNTKIISPCSELKMAKRYLNTIASRLNTSNPNIHVNPSNGSNTAEPFTATLAFFNALPNVALVDAGLPFVVFNALVVVTSLDDNALRKARMKITALICSKENEYTTIDVVIIVKC